MNNTGYILSIAIPTYNRGDILKQNIASWVQEKDFDKVQLVISDNASTDHTEKIVQEFQKNHANIKYNKNLENLGLEPNVKCAIELSDGEFIKVLNDYTSIEKGKLPTLIKYIEENIKQKPNLFFLNSANESNSYICDSLDDFVNKASYWSTWISSFGIWKSDYDNIDHKDTHLGFWFYHTSILFESISKKYTVLLYEKLFTSFRLENKGGYHILVFLEDYFSILVQKYYDCGLISKKVYQNEKKALLRFLYPYIVDAKIKKKNSFEKDRIYEKMSNYYSGKPYFYGYIAKYLLTFVLYKVYKVIWK